jgi:hypothetical protein
MIGLAGRFGLALLSGPPCGRDGYWQLLLRSAEFMTYPVANPKTQAWFDNLNNDVVNLQSYCLNAQTATASGGMANAVDVLNIATSALRLQADIATVSASPALVAALVILFNAQPGWSGVSVAAEFTTLNTLAGNLVIALVGASAEYPHDGASPPHLLDRTWNTVLDGDRDLCFVAGQTVSPVLYHRGILQPAK